MTQYSLADDTVEIRYDSTAIEAYERALLEARRLAAATVAAPAPIAPGAVPVVHVATSNAPAARNNAAWWVVVLVVLLACLAVAAALYWRPASVAVVSAAPSAVLTPDRAAPLAEPPEAALGAPLQGGNAVVYFRHGMGRFDVVTLWVFPSETPAGAPVRQVCAIVAPSRRPLVVAINGSAVPVAAGEASGAGVSQTDLVAALPACRWADGAAPGGADPGRAGDQSGSEA